MAKTDLKYKKTKGRVKVLKVSLYKEHQVYIRMIGTDYFEYLFSHNGEIYSSYIIITPSEGKTKLTMKERNQCMALIYTGAEATIDTLLGESVDEKTQGIIETFEKVRDIVDKK